MLLLQGQPFLSVFILVDRGDAAFELVIVSNAAIVQGHLMRGHRGQMGVGQARWIVPYAVGDLVALVTVLTTDLLPGGGGGRRRCSRCEFGDGITMV